MAVEKLSPWPTADPEATDDALGDARACLRAALGGREADGDSLADPADSLIDRLGSTAAEMVEAYAPDARQAVKNEAVIRIAGWLRGSRSDELILLSQGSISLQYRHNPSRNVLRNSGAAGLLAPWRSPNAAVLESD